MSNSDDLILAFDIESWLSGYTRLRRSGAQLMGSPCPLCGDKRSKFYINDSQDEKRGLWISYCCHEQGNVVQLVRELEGLSGGHARAFIREANGEILLPPAIEPPRVVPPITMPEPIFPADESMTFDHKGKLKTFAERLLSNGIISAYSLGVTGDNTWFRGERKPMLDHRLIIPIHDRDGKLFSWQGRNCLGDTRQKYVFPSGIDVKKTFFGFHRWLREGTSSLNIVEGCFQKFGVDRVGGATAANTVASFGKALSGDQIDLIKDSRAEKIYLAWDHDAIPQMCDAADALRAYGKKVYAVPPHPEIDYDEMPVDEVKDRLGSAVELTVETAIRLNALYTSKRK